MHHGRMNSGEDHRQTGACHHVVVSTGSGLFLPLTFLERFLRSRCVVHRRMTARVDDGLRARASRPRRERFSVMTRSRALGLAIGQSRLSCARF